MALADAVTITLEPHTDERGSFLETYRSADMADVLGHRLAVAQVNCSVSRKGTVRGIHFADVPPGQAKYVTCVHGSVLDVVVDIRTGSPTFGRWDSVVLGDDDPRAVYVAEGLGHVFMALTDDATVSYLCSEPYAPAREHGINPLDPTIAIAWPDDVEALLSPKDTAAPTLEQAQEQGLLPSYDDCLAYYAELRTRGNA